MPAKLNKQTKPLRLAGKTFTNSDGRWIKIESVHFDTISYNCSGAMQWAGGGKQCSREKMREMLERGGYLSNQNK